MALEDLTKLRRLVAVGGIVLMGSLSLAACDNAEDAEETSVESEDDMDEDMDEEEMDDEEMDEEEEEG